jgi:SAM-dependent methyltransferase
MIGRTMAPREWFRGFFDATYLEIIRAQKGAARTRSEVEFVARALDLRPGRRVLDVPCGYGRHSIRFARGGCDVVGVDLSPVMIREARRRPHPRVRFVRGDMRRIEYRDAFDAVACLFTSFGYFSERENVETLRRMARALRPGGRLIVDHRNPAFDATLPSRTWQREGRDIFVLSTLRFDVRTRTQENTWLIVRAGDRRIVQKELRIRLWTPAQWRSRLRDAGLRLRRLYGDLAGRPFRRMSRRLVVLAERV